MSLHILSGFDHYSSTNNCMFLTWDNKPSGQWCPDGFGWGTHVAKEGCSTPERTTRLVSNVADAFVEKTDVLNTTINTKISPFETQRRGVRHALRYFTLMHSVPSSPSLDAKLHDLRGHKEGCTFNESSNRDKVAGRYVWIRCRLCLQFMWLFALGESVVLQRTTCSSPVYFRWGSGKLDSSSVLIFETWEWRANWFFFSIHIIQPCLMFLDCNVWRFEITVCDFCCPSKKTESL